MSLGDRGDKKDRVTVLAELHLNGRGSPSTKKHMRKKKISWPVSSMQKTYKGDYAEG